MTANQLLPAARPRLSREHLLHQNPRRVLTHAGDPGSFLKSPHELIKHELYEAPSSDTISVPVCRHHVRTSRHVSRAGSLADRPTNPDPPLAPLSATDEIYNSQKTDHSFSALRSSWSDCYYCVTQRSPPTPPNRPPTPREPTPASLKECTEQHFESSTAERGGGWGGSGEELRRRGIEQTCCSALHRGGGEVTLIYRDTEPEAEPSPMECEAEFGVKSRSELETRDRAVDNLLSLPGGFTEAERSIHPAEG
ncbi:unnamed protein product [Pleuronectes platessa]|uniref:Uncharacterized protein n=1 Tax=Pleuronectes platessa TaxID=8262 RepID=A0A9N7Z4Z1_PLEPL|nr:unnamed protein product [Pleuronectes platessa]